MVEVKLLVLFAVVAIAASVPMKTKNGDKSKEIHQKMMLNKIRKMILNRQNHPESEEQFKVLEATKAEGLNNVNFRLPNNTTPMHYDITITTSIHQGNLMFTGLTLVYIKVLETSNTITLHSSQIIMDRINLHRADNQEIIERNLAFRSDSVTQFLEVSLREPLQADQEVILAFEHTGVLRSDRIGFYHVQYVNLGSESTWVASTLFEPTHARLAFPCYDEIRYRTTFDITIVHHSSYHALSNMPIARTEVGSIMTRTTFETTPTMPTYNVAFTVSNYAFVSNNDEKLPMRVYAQAAEIEAGRADIALELGGKMWGALEGIFNVPYPLPKSDMVAVTNWRNGESWGLIKIDNWNIFVPGDIVEARQRRIQIAHEYTVS
jgi:aminopeptidase N